MAESQTQAPNRQEPPPQEAQERDAVAAASQPAPVKFTLVTKSEEAMYRATRQELVLPEATIFNCYRQVLPVRQGEDDSNSVLQMHVKTLDRAGSSLADMVFPDLPCLLFNNKRVEKNNIQYFMKRITTINEKFQRETTRESELKIKSLELMCQTQLHLVTVRRAYSHHSLLLLKNLNHLRGSSSIEIQFPYAPVGPAQRPALVCCAAHLAQEQGGHGCVARAGKGVLGHRTRATRDEVQYRETVPRCLGSGPWTRSPDLFRQSKWSW